MENRLKEMENRLKEYEIDYYMGQLDAANKIPKMKDTYAYNEGYENMRQAKEAMENGDYEIEKEEKLSMDSNKKDFIPLDGLNVEDTNNHRRGR